MVDAWTDEWARQNREKHIAEPNWGSGGTHYITRLLELAHRLKVSSVLDYGCGQGSLVYLLRQHLPDCRVVGFDPFVENWCERPSGVFDLVISTDVLEHVEPAFIDQAVGELCEYTAPGGRLFLVIALTEALATMPDGSNAHATVRPVDWWRQVLADALIEPLDARANEFDWAGVFWKP